MTARLWQRRAVFLRLRRAERRAWSAGAFAVAKAEQYGATSATVGSRTWTRTTGADGWDWKAARTPVPKGTAVVTFAG